MKKVLIICLLFLNIQSSYSQPNCWNYSYGPLGSSTNIYLFTASTPHPIIAGCTGEADFDHMIKFTPSTPGYYEVFVYNNYQYTNCWYCTPYINFAFRQSNGLCNYNGFNCLVPDSIRYPTLSYSGIFMLYTIYTPLIDSIYDLLLVPQDPGTVGSTDVIIRCGGPKDISVLPEITDATINFDCNCPNSTFLEYGPKGFIPGTDSLPGGGTVIANVTSPFTLSGLYPYTLYDVYLRTSCGGSFSENKKKSIRTKYDCSNSQNIQCGDFIMYENTVNGIYGSWQNYGCGPGNNNAVEKIFQFTPTVSGIHTLNFYMNWCNGIQTTAYFKEASGTCDQTGWNCIGDLTTAPYTLSWGPLTAGVTYFLLIDGHYSGLTTKKFVRIDCPNVCSPPLIVTVSDITINSAKIYTNCNNCFGNILLEYGPAGFVPGVDSVPGIGGTIVTNITFPYTLTGLQPGTIYDVYARNDCSVPIGYSINTQELTFTTIGCPPDAQIICIGSPAICGNSTVHLKAQHNSSLTYQWQLNGTNITGANYSSYQVGIPGDYTVIVSNSCGSNISPIFTVTTVNSPPSSATITPNGTLNLCGIDSLILSANTAFGYLYQWKHNNNFMYLSTPSIVVTQSGYYMVQVYNGCGGVWSDTVYVNFASPPNASITASGPTTFCIGDSVTLNANTVTGVSYQWQLNGNNISGATNITYDATTSGNYSLIVSDSCGSSISNFISVNDINIPGSVGFISGPSSVCKYSTHTFSINPVADATTYIWNLPPNSQFISGLGTNVATVLMGATPGNISVFASNQCGDGPASVLPVKIKKCFTVEDFVSNNAVQRTISKSEISIYPNPSQNEFNCLIEGEEDQIFSLTVFDYAGRIVELHEDLTSNDNFTFGKNLSPGFYFAEINSGNAKNVSKIIKIE